MPLKAPVDAWVKRMGKRKNGGPIDVASKAAYSQLPRFSSGSFELDVALGGGWPRCRVILVYGPPSSGKTTSAIRACASLQQWCTKCFLHQSECECKTITKGV